MRQSLSLRGWSTRKISLVSFLGILLFPKHLIVIIWGIVGIAQRLMNVTCIVKGWKFIRTVCPSRDILYRRMNLFDCPIHPVTTVTLKPANKPALGYNTYRNVISTGACDVSLQRFNSSKP